MEIDGLDLSKFSRIDSRCRYSQRRGKKYIYLLGSKGDDTLFIKPLYPESRYYSSDITIATATILDEVTNQISTGSVYRDHIGTYIKKRGRKYRLPDFKVDENF